MILLKKLISPIAFSFLLFSIHPGFCESIIVNESGNVGIGTETPTSKLEVNGDLQVNGKIKKGGEYADWYVGSYYSIPVDQRTAQYDWKSTDLTEDWSTINFSSQLPEGVKRIKIYIDASGVPNDNGRMLFQLRPFGATSENYWQSGKGLMQEKNSVNGTPRMASEIEVDVTDGKFEIREYNSSWQVSRVYICLRGFYM